MPRLRSLPSRLNAALSRLGTGATAGASFSRTDGLSAAAPGYDADWRRLRLAHFATHARCEPCRQQGRVTLATQVHHLQRFHGLDDPLRLNPRNCQSICTPCHPRESARQASGKG